MRCSNPRLFFVFFSVLTRFRLFDRHTYVQLWFNTSEWGGIIFRYSTQGNRGVTERQHGESFRGLKYLLTQLPSRLKCQEWGKIRRSCQISYIALFQTSCVAQLIPHPTNIRYKTINRFDLVLERTDQSLRNYALQHFQTYLPLLLLPGRIQQQVPVPVLLLDHVSFFMMNRVGVAVRNLGFDSCHRSTFIRAFASPSTFSKKNESILDMTKPCEDKNLREGSWCRGKIVKSCRDHTPLVRGDCAEMALPLAEDPAGRCSFPGQKWHTWPHPNMYGMRPQGYQVRTLKRLKRRGSTPLAGMHRLWLVARGVSHPPLLHRGFYGLCNAPVAISDP